MPKTHEFVQYLLDDAFREIPGIQAKSMFGGYGLYKDGIFFSIVDQDAGKVYLKVDDQNRPDFENIGMGPFVYGDKGKSMTMQYYELPLNVLENSQELKTWVQKSYDVALRSKKSKRAK